MYLRQVDVVGFRGINRLSINLHPNMVLIGENAWGKSSLLDALRLILNPEKVLYQFQSSDFHIHYENEKITKLRHLTLLFTFSESNQKESNESYNYLYRPIFARHQDGFERIYLRVTGDWRADNSVITEYSFLNENGDPIETENTESLVFTLISRHPVYRFRDARLQRHYYNLHPLPLPKTDSDLQKEIIATGLLLQYYLLDQQLIDIPVKDISLLWARVHSLCQRLQQDSSRQLAHQLFAHLSGLFSSHEKIRFGKFTRPIILLEDLEARLHPRMMAIAWEMAGYLPIQRITTTNSVELLSQVELRSICRLVRYTDRTQSFQLQRRDLSKEDLRRLTFHVHYNRSLALFARMWILVEGETEVWILSELAKLLNINLEMEGIRIVEFAQSGLRPLIKYVKAMGIEWYVLTDGDEAGKKYTEVVRTMLPEGETMSQRITTLPKVDIEHFFYSEGFDDIFIRLAHWIPMKSNPVSRIIQKAIQRTSKPDLAIAISDEIEKRGSQSIPILFKRLFSKVLLLARTQQ
ncbi:putative ATP-dependent endonuclease of OLD family [Cricetibacter osteomyelitidis]|uniref:Putative ATP-dependent endonuclease of OLD family n=1 Tax=Cricetibacter osteomyelitidis TaxID=1521931 RepID=A0A4R2SVI9_9PAST|nr:DUF2813 domain-containing protein [Cricetibacter osteomyelitidis]TCP93510.1 putative ATP-dependent endonuclease of OLD family [Cricetibacter osteomyelitidis]